MMNVNNESKTRIWGFSKLSASIFQMVENTRTIHSLSTSYPQECFWAYFECFLRLCLTGVVDCGSMPYTRR